MVDRGAAPAATAEAPRGPGDGAIINNWLEEGDEAAYLSIVTRVGISSTDQVDRLDAALLSFATMNRDPDVRSRLIKFYAIFKITEMRRYREFRGFPQ